MKRAWNATPCHAMRCVGLQRDATECNGMQWYAMVCNVMQCNGIWWNVSVIPCPVISRHAVPRQMSYVI
eukprot:5453614-Lingulodinium_polyedra.AAC.1